jgi:hypothetical protein
MTRLASRTRRTRSSRPQSSRTRGRAFQLEQLESRQLLAANPFERVNPLGSLVAVSEDNTGAPTTAGEVNDFTFEAQSGQTVSATLQPGPGLRGKLELRNPSNVVIGMATAANPGDPVFLQTVAAGAAGTYTLNVIADGISPGSTSYLADIYLNTAVEEEQFGGPDNGSIATAQDLSASSLTIGSSRLAVTGTASLLTFSASQTQTNNVHAPNVLNFDFAGAPTPLGPGTLTLNAVADLDGSSEFLNVNGEGVFVQNAFVSGGLQQQPVSTTLNLTQAQLAAMQADGTVSFTVTPSPAVNNLGPNSLELVLSYPFAGAGDHYSFSGSSD